MASLLQWILTLLLREVCTGRVLIPMVLALLPPVHAALPGQTMEEVSALHGAPNLKRTQGDRELWFFTGKGKVVFEKGVVTESTLKGTVLPTPDEPAAALPSEAPVEKPMEPADPIGEVETPEPLPVMDTSVFEAHLERLEAAPPPSPRKLSNTGMALIGLGGILSLCCKVLLMVRAAKVSRGLAIAIAIIPLAEIAFAIPYWSEARTPFLILYLVALPLMLFGHHLLFS